MIFCVRSAERALSQGKSFVRVVGYCSDRLGILGRLRNTRLAAPGALLLSGIRYANAAAGLHESCLAADRVVVAGLRSPGLGSAEDHPARHVPAMRVRRDLLGSIRIRISARPEPPLPCID